MTYGLDRNEVWHELAATGLALCGRPISDHRRASVDVRLVCHACRARQSGWLDTWRRAVRVPTPTR